MVATAITLFPWCCGKKPHCLFAEPWKGVGKKCCLPDVFRDSDDTPANLLYELNGHLIFTVFKFHVCLLVDSAILCIFPFECTQT